MSSCTKCRRDYDEEEREAVVTAVEEFAHACREEAKQYRVESKLFDDGSESDEATAQHYIKQAERCDRDAEYFDALEAKLRVTFGMRERRRPVQ